MSVVLAVLLVATAVGAIAVVTCRDVASQAVVLGAYGFVLGALFLALSAPDVALSEVVVGSVLTPLLILLALVKVRGR
ncbi:MAG TPA: hydrogenase subunit MbhD domain-containing protein [Mycobacteriales bacterium]